MSRSFSFGSLFPHLIFLVLVSIQMMNAWGRTSILGTPNPQSKVINCSLGTEGTEDNLIPDCYVSLHFNYEKNKKIVAAKVADLNYTNIAKGDEDFSESVILENYPWVIQECKNWCGPAALQGVLQHFGIKKSQSEIAKDIDSGECDKRPKEPISSVSTPIASQPKNVDYLYRGTCLTDILSHLSKTVKSQLYGADHIGSKLGEFTTIAQMVIERVYRSVKQYRRPVIALINQTPLNADHHFPGFEQARPSLRRAHYITLIGYGGNYSGDDRSGFFYFRDSSGHNRAPKDTVDVNTVVIDLMANAGRGSCSLQGWNLIW